MKQHIAQHTAPKIDSRWTDALNHVRQNVSEQQFDTWFGSIRYNAFDEQNRSLYVQVPSAYVYEYIEEHYVNLLAQALLKAFGFRVRLFYDVLTDKENGLAQTVEGDESEESVSAVPKATRQRAYAGGMEEGEPVPFDSQLNPRQTFSNYIEGDSNKLPRSVGLSIAEHPQTAQFNPMFIYGPSGCGKTHLINAIGMRTRQLYPEKRVLYVSANLFQVQFSNARIKNTFNDFIHFYQSIDMLIVDDVQEWGAKTQETFFHIFNHLFRNGKRIILASDRPPVELQGMNERLITRFSCGLIAELEKPNVQLCVDILNSKIRRDGLSIPAEVVQFIAETANGSVRDLQGVINSLLAYSVVYNSRIDMRLAERVIKRAVKVDDRPLTVDEILEKVCHHFGVQQTGVCGKSRKRDFVVPRQLAMYFTSRLTRMPASRIGRLIGGRDHSTVIHSVSQIEKRLQVDGSFAEEVHSIENSFRLKC